MDVKLPQEIMEAFEIGKALAEGISFRLTTEPDNVGMVLLPKSRPEKRAIRHYELAAPRSEKDPFGGKTFPAVWVDCRVMAHDDDLTILVRLREHKLAHVWIWVGDEGPSNRHATWLGNDTSVRKHLSLIGREDLLATSIMN